MNGPINGPTPLEHLPSFPVSLRMPRGKVVGFHTQSVESGCGLENLTTPLPENSLRRVSFTKIKLKRSQRG